MVDPRGPQGNAPQAITASYLAPSDAGPWKEVDFASLHCLTLMGYVARRNVADGLG